MMKNSAGKTYDDEWWWGNGEWLREIGVNIDEEWWIVVIGMTGVISG